MSLPVRLRLSRVKGFNLQDASAKANGLAAVNVARPSKWGNPYKVAPAFESEGVKIPAITPETAIILFREVWERRIAYSAGDVILRELRGKNLACWCAPDAPCHADVLLDLANREKAP